MSQLNQSEGRILSNREVWIYGTIAVPLAMFGYPIAIWIPPVYASDLGISLAAVGTMLMLARFTDIVTDPVIGYLTDHSKSRFGRRKIFMVLGLPILVLGVALLFMPKTLFGGVPGAWYLLVSIAIMYLGSTMVLIPYGAWGAELTPDYNERSKVTAVREVYTLIGLFIAASIPFVIEFIGERSYSTMLEAMGWGIVVLMPTAVLLVCFLLKEPTKRTAQAQMPIWQGIKLVAKNGPMVRVILIHLIVVGGETFRNGLSVMFMRDVVGVETIGIYYLYYFTAGLIAIPGWLWLGRKIGKHRAFVICMSVVSVISISMYFLGWKMIDEFLILFILKGMCFGGLQFLPLAMLADVVDVDTAKSGERRAGSFMAIYAFTGKFAYAAGVFLPMFILSFSGYDPTVGHDGNLPEHLDALAFHYAILPAVFFVGALWLTWNYPLTPERHARLRYHLERREKWRSEKFL